MPGYIEENELIDHYLLADLFAMPSKKEGFGIVFIEALACGLPVIAGNKDGSADALMNSKLGELIDPDSNRQIFSALLKLLQNHISPKTNEVLNNFSFKSFKERLRKYVVNRQS